MEHRDSRPPQRRADLSAWKDALPGEPCFLIGNGPSASDEDVAGLLSDRFTIGINRAFYLLDPVVLMWQDASLVTTEREKMASLTAIRVCRNIADVDGRSFQYRLQQNEAFRLPHRADVLYGGGATGPLAFQLAHIMGCDPIVLIGFDCKYRGGRTDFYGINPHHHPTTLPNCSRGLHWIAKVESGRRIINCSEGEEFPKRERLADVVASLPPGRGRQGYLDLLRPR